MLRNRLSIIINLGNRFIFLIFFLTSISFFFLVVHLVMLSIANKRHFLTYMFTMNTSVQRHKKMLKFTPFWNFSRALEKMSASKNCCSGIWGWTFSESVLKVLGFLRFIILQKIFLEKNVSCIWNVHTRGGWETVMKKQRKHFPCQSATQPAITIGTLEQGVKYVKS